MRWTDESETGRSSRADAWTEAGVNKTLSVLLFTALSVAHSEDSLGVRTIAAWPYSRQRLRYETTDSVAILAMYSGFWFVDFTDPAHLIRLGEHITWGGVFDMQVKDSLLYVADVERGFRIFNIKSIPDVKEIASVGDRVYDKVLVADTLAYLCQNWSPVIPSYFDTIEVFNIRDPRYPARLVSFSISPGTVRQIAVDGNRLCVAAGSGGLKIYDVSDPTAPTLLGVWRHPDGWRPRALAVRDSLAYVGGTDTLFVLNVATPQSIRKLGALFAAASSEEGYDVTKCVLRDTLLFCVVNDDSSSCAVVNVADPRHPRVVSRTGEGGLLPALKLAGDILITAEPQGAAFYDASNPCSLKLRGRVFLPSLCHDLRARDSLVFLSLVSDGIQVVDISRPPQARPRGRYPPTHTYPRAGGTVPALRDSFVFTGFGDTNYLYVLNAANPDSVFLVGSCLLGPRPYTAVRGVFLKDSLAYVACMNWMGLAICNVKDPHSPVLLSRIEIPGGSADCYYAVVQNNLAYVASGGEGLWIVDVTSPVSPQLRGHLPTPGFATTDVAVRDSIAFIVDDYAGCRIVNVRNPDDPVVIGVIPPVLLQQALGLWLDRNLLYLAHGFAGLRIYDVSDVTSPTEVGHYRTASPMCRVHVKDGLIHVADYSGGYRCLQYYGAGVVEEQEDTTGNAFHCWPTVGSRFSVRTDSRAASAVYDSQGRMVAEVPAGQATLSLRGRPPGVYFLVSLCKSGHRTRKVVCAY